MIVTSPEEVGGLMAASLDDIATTKLNRTIGGPPQFAYVQLGKTFPMSFYAQNGRTGTFEKRTAAYDEVRPASSGAVRSRLAGFRRE